MAQYCVAALMTLLVVGSAPLAFARDVRFQTTKEEMIQELTKEPMGTRAFVPQGQMRRIVVVEKEKAQTVKKTVTVNKAQSVPRAKLKIEFDYDSYAIRQESFPLLDELGRALISNQLQGKQILIMGHTDSDGTDGYNLKLSLNRALSVKNYLVGNFPIEGDRLKTVGYGEAMPLVPNTSVDNRQMNRRVEVQMAR